MKVKAGSVRSKQFLLEGAKRNESSAEGGPWPRAPFLGRLQKRRALMYCADPSQANGLLGPPSIRCGLSGSYQHGEESGGRTALCGGALCVLAGESRVCS